MVTLNSNDPAATIAIEAAGRVIAAPETGVTRNYMLMRSYLSWGSIIAGSMLVLSLMILSASLAYACDVPGFSGGVYGWGSGVWSVITAAVTFYCGGCLASYFASAADTRNRFLHGVMAWGLTLPLLAIFFFTFIGVAGVWASHASLASGTAVAASYAPAAGAAWGTFLSLGVGLIFTSIGASVGTSMQDRAMSGTR